jgi:hypothetical protein
MAKLLWKQLASGNDDSDIVTWRARVPGGWLVSVWAARTQADATGQTPLSGGSNWGGGVTFVPVIDWDVEEES